MIDYKKVFIDTAPFICYIEGSVGNPFYSEKAKKFFKNCYENDVKIINSVITVEEYKVFPYRMKQQEYIASFERLISLLQIDINNIDKTIAEKAAKIGQNIKDSRLWMLCSWLQLV